MKHNLTYFLVMLLACLSAKAAQVNTEKTISVNGTTRSYILYVPDNLASSPALVFSLHGASGHSTDRSPFRTSVADSKGCIVVYPQGANQYFAVFGGTTTGWNASGEPNEDLDFFKAIISEVTAAYPQIDKNRIYCTGFSNGGMMVYSNSNTASDIFAAFASISGYPINEMHLHHSGARPVPFLHIHGKADDFVKYSLMGTIRDNMVARNGCNPVPTVTKGTNYTKSFYAAGYNSFPYVYYEIDGMGHNDYTSYTEDGNSALTMWNFISNYKLTDTCDRTLKWNPNLDLNGFEPSEHGWTVTDGTKFVYGDATTTQNVSHSLQFEKGDYQLRILTTGTSSNKVKIKLASTSGTQVLYKYVNIGTKAYIPFSIPEYGEYTITIIKDASTDKFSILGIYMTSSAWSGAEEITGNDIITVTEEVPFTQTDSGTTRCSMSTSNGVTTFTTKNNSDVEVVYKMLNVDVSGYSKVIVNFAEATTQEFLSVFGTQWITLPAGTTSYTYDIASGTTKLDEISLISLWKPAGITVKVKSVQLYKEVETEVTRFDKGDVDCNGEINLTDLITLIKLLNTANASYYSCADVNGDNTVNKDDISSLSTILLSK